MPDSAPRLLHHGHAAAARADDEAARVDEASDRLELDDLAGLGAGHHAAPAAPRVLAHREALLEHHLPRHALGVEGADRLARVRERHVLGVDRHLGDDADHRGCEPALLQVVGQGLRRHVADLALALGAADVHRHRRHGLRGERVLDQQVAHLRAVAVREHDPPAVLGQLRDAAHRAVDVEQLLLERADLAGLEDGVAAEGDHHGSSLTHPVSPIGCRPPQWDCMLRHTLFMRRRADQWTPAHDAASALFNRPNRRDSRVAGAHSQPFRVVSTSRARTPRYASVRPPDVLKSTLRTSSMRATRFLRVLRCT